MSRERIEVHIEPIAREEWEATRSQHLSQGVNHQVRHVLRTGTQVEDRKNLRQRVDGQPQPQHLRAAA